MKTAALTASFLALLAACSALAACGAASSAHDSSTILLEGEEGRPDVPVPLGPPPRKLVVVDLEKGTGPPARDGDELSVRYFNLAYRGHRVYEDQWREPAPSFVLGDGQMVEAWEEGLPGVRSGGRRELVVPGGRTTFGNDPEIYVVEVLSIKRTVRSGAAAPATRRVKGTGPRPKIHLPGSSPSHVVVRVLKRGSGPAVRPGESLAARYIGKNATTGRVQDFWSEQQPYRFTLGQNRLAKAWEVGLKGMKLGGRRELIVPSRLAYGDGTMVYVIELLEMEKRQPRRAG